MKNVTNLYIHIGLMKTASTFLQTRVFPNIPETQYLGLHFSFHRRWLSLQKLNNPIVSNETCSGVWFKDIEVDMDYFERFKTCIDNVCNIYSDPKIICVFREPGSFILSSYKQYLHQGGTLNWEGFSKVFIKSKEQFCFSNFIKYLKERCEEGNYLILTLEMLKKDRNNFIGNIEEFITGRRSQSKDWMKRDSPSNISVPMRYERLLILINKMSWILSPIEKYLSIIKIRGIPFRFSWLPRVILPKIFGAGKKEHDISELVLFYQEDWAQCLKMIDQNNDKLFSSCFD